jgi:RNA polymerase sigma-70 factor (ECF subfamily)
MANDLVVEDITALLEPYRRELTGYCYRMLGSGFEAEDAVQDTFVKAWKNYDTFEGRSSLRSWLYRIATNVCLDMVRGPQRRARPMEFGPASPVETAAVGPVHPEKTWIQPIPDAKVVPTDGDPADIAMARETIRLAFIAALQNLPPKQRSVLILREVLRWQATEVAELLDTTVASVNSALQRARETMGDLDLDGTKTSVSEEQEALLAKYVDAFERYDVDELVTLLRDDAVLSMPPYALWLQGHHNIAGWFLGEGIGCKGSRLLATSANGGFAFGSYRPDPDGGHAPWALQIIETDGSRITGHHNFLNTELFEYFGLPAHLPAG